MLLDSSESLQSLSIRGVCCFQVPGLRVDSGVEGDELVSVQEPEVRQADSGVDSEE